MMITDLSKIEFARVAFKLEFQEAFVLKRNMVLRLRREFQRVARQAQQAGSSSASGFEQLLDPQLSSDPLARRLYQKPSPPFIIHAPPDSESELKAGDSLSLVVSFMGNINHFVAIFAALLSSLGENGFYQGQGKFVLTGLAGFDQSGNLLQGELNPDFEAQLVIPQLNLNWLIEEKIQYDRNIGLTFLTPARLISNNKPLFQVGFVDIFPFMLRRVTSMLHAWGGVELTDDSQYLIASATRIEVLACELAWQDWRTVDDGFESHELGGVIGHLVLGRVESDDLASVIALAALLNIGKSAAYGCGSFRIDFSD